MKITYKRLQALQQNIMQLGQLPHEATLSTVKNIELFEATLKKGTDEATKIAGFKEYQERHNTEWRFFIEANQINAKRQLTQQEQASWQDRVKRFNEKPINKVVIDALTALDNKKVEVDVSVITDLTNIPPTFVLNNKELFKY